MAFVPIVPGHRRRPGPSALRVLFVGALVLGALWWSSPQRGEPLPLQAAPVGVARVDFDFDLGRLREAFAAGRGDLWVTLQGTVERALPDDERGARHQRFVLRLAEDLTVLVAHNIDLAPRVPLAVDDRLTLHGEYEWNAQGGVLHWTHHAPDGGSGGWIELDGLRYR